VSILTPERDWVISRTFATLTAARKWAVWCSRTWQAAIDNGEPGGARIADYAKRAA
jgi:hypothetical protein